MVPCVLFLIEPVARRTWDFDVILVRYLIAYEGMFTL